MTDCESFESVSYFSVGKEVAERERVVVRVVGNESVMLLVSVSRSKVRHVEHWVKGVKGVAWWWHVVQDVVRVGECECSESC